jgi:hypothetical protein
VEHFLDWASQNPKADVKTTVDISKVGVIGLTASAGGRSFHKTFVFKTPDFQERDGFITTWNFACCYTSIGGSPMKTQAVLRNTQNQLVDIPSAAFQAGYSLHHFRKIVAEDHIPVKRIGQKLFITMADLETWKSTHGETRLEDCLKQLEKWVKGTDVRRGAQPVQDLGDDD